MVKTLPVMLSNSCNLPTILIYTCPKCITFNNTLSPPLHIAPRASTQPDHYNNIDETIPQT